MVAEMFRRNRKMTRTTSADRRQQRQLDVAHRFADRSGAIAADVERDRGRQLLAERRQQLPRRASTTATTLVPGCFWIARKHRARSPLIPAGGLVVFDAVVDVRHLVEPHRVAVAVGDDRRAVCRGAQQLAVGEDGERLVSTVDGAGRQVRVGVRDRRGDLVDADAVGARAAAGSRSTRTA